MKDSANFKTVGVLILLVALELKPLLACRSVFALDVTTANAASPVAQRQKMTTRLAIFDFVILQEVVDLYLLYV